jgi:hypothetical protein
MENFLQSAILTDFLYPFLLIFFLVFAILEKTKILGGDDKKQLNAFISLIIGLIFVSFVFPKIIVENLILFMTVGIVVVFVGLVVWGLVSGKGEIGSSFKTPFAILVIISVIVALLWATGAFGPLGEVLTSLFVFLFDSEFSSTLWSNVLLIVLIAGGIAIAIGKKAKSD